MTNRHLDQPWDEVELDQRSTSAHHRDARRDQFAREHGVEPAQVRTIRLELNELLRAGSLWDVDIEGTSLLFASVSWREYGINESSDERAKKFTRGQKPLFPEELYRPIQSLEVRFRQTLARFGYRIAGFDKYTWVPATAFESWMRRHRELLEEFNERKGKLLAAHAHVVEMKREEFHRFAARAWRAFEASSDAVQVGRDDYIADVVARALGQIPTREALDARLRVVLKPALIEHDASIAQAEAEAQSYRLQREELRLREEQVRAMRLAQMDHARQQLSSMASPWDEVIHGFGAKLYAAVQEVQKVIEKHGYLPGKTAEKARGLRDMYQVLAIARNGRIEDSLDALERAMSTRPPERINGKELSYDPELVKEALDTIASVTIESARMMTQIRPQEWEEIEV